MSGSGLRTCELRRVLPDGEWSDWETHTDLRGSPMGDQVLVWEYGRLVRPRSDGGGREHVEVMYCAAGWHSTGGTAAAPDDPQLCSAILSPQWSEHPADEERFKQYWEFHEENPVVWIVKISAPGHRRLAYCDPELPAEYRPREDGSP
ncbi:MAG: hypothetical protein ACRDOB_05235 [Streptosporangiaceae bacterium]